LPDNGRGDDAFVAIRDILFHLDTEHSGRQVADFALSLAATTGARLTAAGVAIEYPPPMVHPSIGMMGFSGLAGIEALSREHRAAVERSYKDFIERAPAALAIELAVIHGYRTAACHDFARLARYFDLSIVGQGAPGEDQLDQLVASATLFGSGRPAFVVPFIHKGAAKLERAMICWDGGIQAARALFASLPLLAYAKSVEVVRIGANTDAGMPEISIVDHLARHAITAVMNELPAADQVGEAILSHAADSGADFIVMGGYGHWRFAEIVLGGTTREVLTSMTTPVLMAH
jgi:nucleotide-binding universal stress UspA family protein